MNRWYIEKIYEIIESLVRIKYEKLPDKDFFESDELKIVVKTNLDVFIDMLNKRELTEEEFSSFTKTACNEFRSKNRTSIQQSRSLVHNIDQWLVDQRMTEAGWNQESFCSYRKRYFEYLGNNGWPQKVISEAERSSLEIVKKLGDPKSKSSFFRRGLVVGSVQSGKTANFNGVINSALDTGYELIIVLSGLMEDLRKQTQLRIEKDVIGKWLGGDRYKGVGTVCAFSGFLKEENCNVPQIESITSVETDFNTGLLGAGITLAGKKILVCKKNVSVLGNLLLSLQEYVNESHPKIDVPLLIIDDESDNASLNNLGYREEFNPTKTNLLIRSILNLFSKKTYLGYTATPFANLLQYRNENSYIFHFIKNQGKENEQDYGTFELSEDLFPEHFIELLYPPSNYVGIKSFFDSKNPRQKRIHDLIVDIEDDYIPHIPPRFFQSDDEPTDSWEPGTRAAKKLEYNEQFRDENDNEDTYPYSLPNSLKDAVKCFIVSIAVRYSRKELMKDSKIFNPHHTMLIHISRYGTWQNKLKKLIVEEVKVINDALASSRIDEEIYQDFQRIWNVYFHYIINNIHSYLPDGYEDPFLAKREFQADILPLLPRAAQNIETLSVNSSAVGDDLKYSDQEKKYIAIGGNRLSRGFTLEGLTINYFLRAANTMDTLMQMGRWFGYRPGYLDCCKLFTIGSNIDKFNEASLVIEDLEEKFERLSKLPNRTPSDFTLWIQNNPDVIRLTRSNFLRDLRELSLDYGDSVKMSTSFNIKKDKVQLLWDSFSKQIKKFNWSILGKEDFLYIDTDQEGMLSFIQLDGVKEVMVNLNTLGLQGYLEECAEYQTLKNWRIAVKIVRQGKGKEVNIFDSGFKTALEKSYTTRLIQRSGPAEDSHHAVLNLVKHDIFKARNSTILASPKDFAVHLSREEILSAEQAFRESKIQELIDLQKDPEIAREEVMKMSIPDRAYRSKMDASKGVLIIYLIDYAKIFEKNPNKKVVDYAITNDSLNFTTPLVGYALGFPSVEVVSGQTFVSRNVFKEPYEMNLEELREFCREKELPIENFEIMEEEELKENIMEYLAI